MSISPIEINAFLDGELSPTEQDRVRRSVAEDTNSGALHKRLAAVQSISALDRGRLSAAEVDAAAGRVRSRLQHSVRGLSIRRPWWETNVRVPLPLAAAASFAFLLMTVMFVVQSGRTGYRDVGGLAVDSGTVNLQVNVDGAATEELLDWLNEQESLNSVSIQLPEQAQFQLRGDPVLMRRDGQNPHIEPAARSDSELEIVPLEEGER